MNNQPYNPNVMKAPQAMPHNPITPNSASNLPSTMIPNGQINGESRAAYHPPLSSGNTNSQIAYSKQTGEPSMQGTNKPSTLNGSTSLLNPQNAIPSAYNVPKPLAQVANRVSEPSMSLLPPPYLNQYVSATPSPVQSSGQSAPQSTKSSRNPSPLPHTSYDYLEGQFPSSTISPSSSSNSLDNGLQDRVNSQNPTQGRYMNHLPATSQNSQLSTGRSPFENNYNAMQSVQGVQSMPPNSFQPKFNHPSSSVPPNVSMNNIVNSTRPIAPPNSTSQSLQPNGNETSYSNNYGPPTNAVVQQPHKSSVNVPPMSGNYLPRSAAGSNIRRKYPEMPTQAQPRPSMQPVQRMQNYPAQPMNRYPHQAPSYTSPQTSAIAPPTGEMPMPPGYNANQNQIPASQNIKPSGQSVNQQTQFSRYGRPGAHPDQLASQLGSMNIYKGNESFNIMQNKNVLPESKLVDPQPPIPDSHRNCKPEIFRCTLNSIPETSNLLQKVRLPLGVLIHPFRDLSNLPVIQCSAIVRCRSCRTYINPFVYFVDQKKWRCNLCHKVNELPEEFLYDPASKEYGDPSRRPEVNSSTIEFIAPSEYMLRPPQPAVYLYLLDVTRSAIATGYLDVFCDTLLAELDNIPGDARTQIGFITYDSCLHFYNLSEGLSQPQMMVVSDIDDIFIPLPDSLLVNIHESKELVRDLLSTLPSKFANNYETESSLGAALQAAYKLMAPTGGRITVMNTRLPSVGPGSLKPREDPNQRAAKDIQNLGPAIDFYKKLSLDCSGQQIAVDLFVISSQYTDIASLSCVSKFSGGCLYHYPGFQSKANPMEYVRYKKDLHRYITRKIGFEAVMRIRCTQGISIHTFHGNFFVRSTDLLSLPNINPDASFGMHMSLEESLSDVKTACFQAALLYTSSKGERRIRVHTLCLPVTTSISDVISNADQQAVASLVSKMAVDRSLTSSMTDAREALINVLIDSFSAYKSISPSNVSGGLLVPYSLRLLPLYILAILKSVSFRVGTSTKLDERLFAMNQLKTLPLQYLIQTVYPDMYPVHALESYPTVQHNGLEVSQPPILHLSSERTDRHGAYLLDSGKMMYLYVCSAISDLFCQNVLNVQCFAAIPEEMVQLPELDTMQSKRLCTFIKHLNSKRPFYAPLRVLRDDSKLKFLFLQHIIEDRTESTYSYYEFLQHVQQEVTK